MLACWGRQLPSEGFSFRWVHDSDPRGFSPINSEHAGAKFITKLSSVDTRRDDVTRAGNAWADGMGLEGGKVVHKKRQ